MLTGAFTAVTVSYLTGSWVLGILISMVAGLLIAMIMAVGHIKYKAEICAIGMGINLFAIAFTKFMLNSVLGVSGSFTSPQIKGIPLICGLVKDPLTPSTLLSMNLVKAMANRLIPIPIAQISALYLMCPTAIIIAMRSPATIEIRIPRTQLPVR